MSARRQATHRQAQKLGKRERYAKVSNSSSDLTLLEVMLAMTILAIALVAVFQSQSQSISMAGQARFATTPFLLAQSKMAEAGNDGT